MGGGGRFFDVLMGLVFVALATTLVMHPNTAGDVTAAGNAFSHSLTASIGK